MNPAACTQPASPPSSPTASAVGDIVTGICIHGTVDQNFLPTSYVADVTIEGITSTGWSGEVWAPDGTLLTQSRQLATVMPFKL